MSDQAQQAQAPQQVPIEDRIAQYVRLRDKIKELDDAHKEKMKPFRETLEGLNNLLLDHLTKIGGDSVKTKHGTVYRTSRKSASLEDGDAFMSFVIEKELWDLLDRRANSTAVDAFAQENGVLPPGVKFTVTHQVGVRRA